MKQAKVLTVAERKRLLAIIANDRHSERNRLAVMLSFFAGLRVGEIAALKISDIVDGEDRVRDQLRLNPAYTKGGESRTIFMNRRLQREIRRYLNSLRPMRSPFCLTMKLPKVLILTGSWSIRHLAISSNTLSRSAAHSFRERSTSPRRTSTRSARVMVLPDMKIPRFR